MIVEYVELSEPFRSDHVRISPGSFKPLHSHPNVWELAVVVKGTGLKTVGEQTSSFSPGDATLLPPGTPHHWAFNRSDTDDTGKVESLVIFIRDDWLHAVAGLTPTLWRTLEPLFGTHDSIVLGGRDRARLNALVRRARQDTEDLRALRLIEAIHLFASAADARHVRNRGSRTSDDEFRDHVRAFIAHNYMRPITLQDAAREFGTCRSSFCVRFKAVLGTTFVDYVNGIRIQRACSLLCRTPLSVTEVAASVGFSDLAYFNRQFRRQIGMSPSAWRRGERLTAD